MGLRSRTLTIVSLVLAVLFAALFFIARPPIEDAFSKLEQERALLDGERLGRTVQAEADRLARVTADWAPRNATYSYMRGSNPDYELELTADSLTQVGVNVLLMVNEQGEVVVSRFVDVDLGVLDEVDPAVIDAILSADVMAAPGDPRAHIEGAIEYPDGVMIVASRSISTSDRYGAPEGTLIVARYVDDTLVHAMADDSRLSIAAFEVGAADLPEDVVQVRGSLESSDSVARVLDSDTIAAYVPIRGLQGEPLMILRADTAREVNAVGRAALAAFAIALVLVAGVSVAAVGFVIDHFVLTRVSFLSSEMSTITIRRDLATRVSVRGEDEISSLATDINDALDAIEDTEQELVHARDQLEARVAERTEELHSSESRYRSLVERLADAVFLVDRDGIVTFANRRAAEIAERPLSEVVGKPFESLLTPASAEDVARRTQAGAAHLAGLTLEVKMGDAVCGPAPVELRSVPLVDESGVPAGTQWIARDIAERKRFEEQLVHMANHDYLTGLFNRQFFESALDLELAESRRTSRGGAILWFDVDDFKEVNDTLGHRAGDEVLVSLSTKLRNELRGSTVLSRLGGDEFAVLMPGVTAGEAEQVAERLLTTINSHTYSATGHAVRLSASIGVVMYPEHGLMPGELLANADVAMYLAKASGRSCVHMHAVDEALRDDMHTRIRWNERLSDALREDRFRVYAQPVLDLRTDMVVRYELLIRMMVDDEIVAPGEFLPAAERLGVIRDIDRWMVVQAIELLSEDALNGTSMEVNLSGRAFGDTELPTIIQRELAQRGVRPQRLGFEITETAAIADMAQAQRFICSLKQLGCRFSLDDFGSGFSSFYYLKHLPIDCLKVDGSLVRSLPDSTQDQYLVRGIVELCRGLGVEIAVEYVEDEETLELVRGLGVDLAQGYHIGRPTPVREPVPVVEGSGV